MLPASQPPPLHDLSLRTQEILIGIEDTSLRDDVEELVRAAQHALTALARVHLPQDELEQGDDGERAKVGQDKHIELAPYVLAALVAINELTEIAARSFPMPEDSHAPLADDDFDLAFDLVDGPTGEDSRLSVQKSDARLSLREQTAEVATAMAQMLQSRVASLAPRLRYALEQRDGWPLLTELDDYQHGLAKGVQGLLFGVLGVFCETAKREEILPQYRSAVREAVDLRAAVADLTYHIGRFNNAIAGAGAVDLVPLVVGVADRVARFSARPEYRTLRAEDKKSVIDFRRTLFALRHALGGVPVTELRRAVEGFSKFLEAMHSINHREVLVVHDRQRLADALELIAESTDLSVVDPEAARGRMQGIVRLLSSVMGRHPELDQALRTFGASDTSADVQAELARWQALVENALATVG